jgi:hypothetical protein
MKTIFRFLGLGVVSAAFIAAGTTGGFAQDTNCADVDGQTASYTKFTELYAKKTAAELKTALATGKEFLEKYGSCETLKDQIAFVQPQVQRIEKLIPDLEKGEVLRPLLARYDAGVQANNADEVYSAGKAILAIQPDNLNVMVPMGVIGTYQSTAANNYKYSDDGIRYASAALAKIKSGAEFTKKDASGEPTVGVFKYTYKKQEAIDQLTYTLAHLNFYGKKDKKAALPYYYELAQSSGVFKSDPRIYATIGGYFASEIPKLTQDVANLIAKQKALPTDDEKLAMEPEIKAAIALLNGYAERAMDGFVRAYAVAKADTPADKTYKESIYKDLTVLYQGRFEKKDGLDAYIASVTAKPMPDPMSPVAPVSDPEPASTTGTTAPAAATPAATTKANGKTATATKP